MVIFDIVLFWISGLVLYAGKIEYLDIDKKV